MFRLHKPLRFLIILLALSFAAITIHAHNITIDQLPGVIAGRVSRGQPLPRDAQAPVVPGTNLREFAFTVANDLAGSLITGIGFALPGDLTGFVVSSDNPFPVTFTLQSAITNGFGTGQTFDFAALGLPGGGIAQGQSLTFWVRAPSFAGLNLEEIIGSAYVRFQAVTPGGFTGIGQATEPAPIPEPTSLFLLGTGLIGLASGIHRKHRKMRETQIN
ncbi:MAG TPA: PEP-CTERM sorting domain-containing protein [Blastocatellia bacterium]|nr:PEP-CTERM sorting domain-containing protein [Blastocatellia bacterium]